MSTVALGLGTGADDSRPSPFELRGYIYPQGHKATITLLRPPHDAESLSSLSNLLQHGASASAERRAATLSGSSILCFINPWAVASNRHDKGQTTGISAVDRDALWLLLRGTADLRDRGIVVSR